ncbi:DUF4175 domain-containing protein [Actibacterium sp.]|uniref:DUF4175 domain-containing protein n=1 Tax=Actibacterium sp. TaxID=1872125 RepID=UPI0035690632
MTDLTALRSKARADLARPLRLTRWGMLAERLIRAFWPLWSVLCAAVALAALGVQNAVPLWVVQAVAALALIVALVTAFQGARRFRWPTRSEVEARLDHTLKGRPIATLADAQAIGASDPASQAVWQAHLARMAARVRQARPVPADLRLSRYDALGLRYVALTGLIAAGLFGSVAQIGSVSVLPGGMGTAVAGGPAWEGWAEPPSYTALPTLYLNDVPSGALSLPEGTRLTLRFYGDSKRLGLSQDVAKAAPSDDPAAGNSFELERSGRLSVQGPGGRDWQILMHPDLPPKVTITGLATRDAEGKMELPFAASDDYGITGGHAVITLNLAQVSRDHGLAATPDPRESLVLDLPRPLRADRTDFEDFLIDNLSQHAWAGLPVTVTLEVRDARGQAGLSPAEDMILPGRRFFDPLANAIIEQRRDLLWTRDNGRRVAQVLRAISARPDSLDIPSSAYLKLRAAIRQLEAGLPDGLGDQTRDELALALWDLALELELGDLNDARARLDRAQDRLSEAMKNGANKDEIAALMQELREAMQDYLQQLAEQQQGDDQQFSENDPNAQTLSADQLEQMLARIQDLMEQGRMAEAQQLMQELAQMMQNMRVTQGDGQNGDGQGNGAREGLQETLRDQQDLSDDAFGDLQRRFDPDGTPAPGQEGDAQRPGGDLADRQEALRDQLQELQRAMPGLGGEEGKALRESLDQAGRAMDRAEDRLRNDDLAGALDDQAEAIDALRNGMGAMDRAQAQRQQQQGAQGAENGQGDQGGRRDPLGRNGGNGADEGDTRSGRRHEARDQERALELMDEIRRRALDRTRPEAELDYLKRLLDLF